MYIYRSSSTRTTSGKIVTPESSRSVATAYRAADIIINTIAALPLQKFHQVGDRKERVKPDARLRNDPYLMEISPNRWGWTPQLFKKAWAQWLVFYGNAFIWSPPVWPFEKFILSAETTYPYFDENGELWYSTIFADGTHDFIPAPEIMHSMINPDESGMYGTGIVSFARESIGRQISAYDAESKLFKDGMTPAAYLQVNSTLDEKGRKTYRDSYGEVMRGDYDGIRLAVFDNRITKYEPITMKMVDAQFLELMGSTDRDIANFFGIPLHMLNMGGEAHLSNEENYLEFLISSINPYLLGFEQGARVKWLNEAEQPDYFWKFNRDALLQMSGTARAEMNEVLIRSGQRSPNETRDKDDYSGYAEGEKFYMTKNYGDTAATGDATNAQKQ